MRFVFFARELLAIKRAALFALPAILKMLLAASKQTRVTRNTCYISLKFLTSRQRKINSPHPSHYVWLAEQPSLLALVSWAFHCTRYIRSHKNHDHTICIKLLLVSLVLVITSFQSLSSRRTPVPWLTTRLTDIPASLARSRRPLTESTAFRADAFAFGNESRTSIAVDSFTSVRALFIGAICLVLSWVRCLELLREEVHVTLTQLVGATGCARSGASWNIFRV